MYITINDFLGILKNFPKDYEKYLHLKDEYVFDGN